MPNCQNVTMYSFNLNCFPKFDILFECLTCLLITLVQLLLVVIYSCSILKKYVIYYVTSYFYLIKQVCQLDQFH